MNKKAQLGIGSFMMIFITVVVGVALFTSVAQDVGTSTSTVTLGPTVKNYTLLAADVPDAINGTVDLIGQDLFSTPVVINGTGGATIPAQHYTIGERVSPTTGVKTIYFQLDNLTSSGANLTATGEIGLNITYIYGPDGYINSSGGRAMANLIGIFMALVIAMVALTPTLQSKLLDAMGK